MKDKIFERLAPQCGLTYVSEPVPAVYGVFNGFGLIVRHLVSEHQYVIYISAKATSNEAASAMMTSLNQFSVERKKYMNYATYQDAVVALSLRENIDLNINKVIPLFKEAIEAAVYFCNQCGFIPVCKYCGSQSDLGFFAIGENVDTMCTSCFNNQQMQMSNKAMTEANKQFNLPLGILGAFLGALIGGVLWIVTSQMGFIIFITGALTVFLSCMLLKKMGGKFTAGGLVIALVISLAMVFIAEYISDGVIICNELQWSLSESFEFLNMILFENNFDELGSSFRGAVNDIRAEVVKDLIYGIISYSVAAVVFIAQYIRDRKVQYRAVRLG